MNPAIRYFLLGLGTAVLSCQISGCGLLRHAADTPRQAPAPLFEADPVRYTVEIKTEDLPAGDSAGELRSAMEKHSQLLLLKDKLPDGMLGLTRRARSDEQNAVKLLHMQRRMAGINGNGKPVAFYMGKGRSVPLGLKVRYMYPVGYADKFHGALPFLLFDYTIKGGIIYIAIAKEPLSWYT